MSEVNLYNKDLIFSSTKVNEHTSIRELASGHAKIDKETHWPECTRPTGNWGETLSSLPNVNAKLVWKNGAEKLSQTLNNVRTTFGVLSQRIKKSTKRRKPLVNMNSPKSPATPYTRSKLSLGRTPTKLYSPFTVDTPGNKENCRRIDETKTFIGNENGNEEIRKLRRTRLNMKTCEEDTKQGESLLANDMLETQIGIYEFQSIANRIVKHRNKNNLI